MRHTMNDALALPISKRSVGSGRRGARTLATATNALPALRRND